MSAFFALMRVFLYSPFHIILRVISMKKRTLTSVHVLAAVFAIGVFATPIAAAPAIEVEVGKSGPGDDYVCWGPVEARARLKSPQATPLQIRITTTAHDAAKKSGELAFSMGPAGGLRSDLISSAKQIEIELPANGSWSPFYILGTVASSEDKDVSIIVGDQSGAELLRYPVMVRVRKNAESLTDGERDRFLSAFLKASLRNNQYEKYWGIHSDAARLAHQSAFVPWHRVFLINLERELQVEDPSVALPYWEFDKPAKKGFTEQFMGRVDPSSADPTLVRFASTNPLSRWEIHDPIQTLIEQGKIEGKAGVGYLSLAPTTVASPYVAKFATAPDLSVRAAAIGQLSFNPQYTDVVRDVALKEDAPSLVVTAALPGLATTDVERFPSYGLALARNKNLDGRVRSQALELAVKSTITGKTPLATVRLLVPAFHETATELDSKSALDAVKSLKSTYKITD